VRGRARGTVDSYRGAVEASLLNLGVRDLEALGRVTFADLDRHLRALHLAGRARSTIVGVVAASRSFWEYSTLVGVVPVNPALALRGPSTSYVPEAPYLTEGETRKLLFGARPGWIPSDWIAARNRVMVAVSFAAGLRVSEPGRLPFDDTRYDEEAGTWSILIRAAKWSEADVRMVIRDEWVGRLLGHWVTALRGRYTGAVSSRHLFPPARGAGELSSRQVHRVFGVLVEQAEIRPRGREITFHILRHTLATLCAQAGWELKAIQTLLRHRSERTTLRYVHTRDDRLDRLWKHKHPLKTARKRGGRELVSDLANVLSIHAGA
jgi:site-specific recombinase XerD